MFQDQSVRDFFGCPRQKPDPTVAPLPPANTGTVFRIKLANHGEEADVVDDNHLTDNRELIQSNRKASSGTNDNRLILLSDNEPEVNNTRNSNVFLSNHPVYQQSPTSSSPVYTEENYTDAKITATDRFSVTDSPLELEQYHHHHHQDEFPIPEPTSPTLRESDSILLTIFIAIVICACIATILLAFLTIIGNVSLWYKQFNQLTKMIQTIGKKKESPRFEGARIERTIPKPTIIGLDYHQRKNSSASTNSHLNIINRYDSMNSLTAIYSQINKPFKSAQQLSSRVNLVEPDNGPFQTLQTYHRTNLLVSSGDPPASTAATTEKSPHIKTMRRTKPIETSSRKIGTQTSDKERSFTNLDI